MKQSQKKAAMPKLEEVSISPMAKQQSNNIKAAMGSPESEYAGANSPVKSQYINKAPSLGNLTGDNNINMGNSSIVDIVGSDMTMQNLTKPLRGPSNEQESEELKERISFNNSNQIRPSKPRRKSSDDYNIGNHMNQIQLNLQVDEQQKMMENFRMMLLNFKGNSTVNIKNEDAEKAKQIEELSARLEILERERILFSKHFALKESNCLERIKSLEQQSASSDKTDLALLHKLNRDYENQIGQLKNVLTGMTNKHNDEKQKFNSTVADVITLKEKLLEEIKNLEKIKKDVMTFEAGWHDRRKSHEKMELVIMNNESVDAADVDLDRNLSLKLGKGFDSNNITNKKKKPAERYQTIASSSVSPKMNAENKEVLLDKEKKGSLLNNMNISTGSPNLNAKPKVPSIINKRIKNKKENSHDLNNINVNNSASTEQLPDFGIAIGVNNTNNSNIKTKSNSQPELNDNYEVKLRNYKM